MAAQKITEAQLAEYVDLDAQRKELDRQSRALAKRQATLSDHFKAELDRLGQRSTKRGAYQVAIVEGRGTVAWKDRLIDEIGPLRVAQIAEAAPPKTKVVVEAVQASTTKRAA